MNKHDLTIDRLVRRLESKGYDQMFLRLEYSGYNNRKKKVCGEFDVLAIKGRRAVYYEIKSNDTKKGYGKALVQFQRASPVLRRMGYSACFVYVTPTRVLRVRF